MPASVLAACSAIGGEPTQGFQGNWVVALPIDGGPVCKDISYLGTDSATCYVSLDLTANGIALTNGTGTADEEECRTGSYPMANPGVNTPGHWDAALHLYLPAGTS